MTLTASDLITTDRTHRTRYLKSISAPDDNMLKPASHNKKLGGKVAIKKWQHMPMYALTLEERHSCTTSCAQYTICYGNNMPFAKRHDHTDPAFFKKLSQSIQAVASQKKNADGFVVRLHVLGDFFSVKYVSAWQSALIKHQGLRVFGYTHHRHDSPIGKRIAGLNQLYPDRFQVRFSDDMGTQFRARVIQGTYDKSLKHFIDYNKQEVQNDELVCPEQLGKTSGCSTCGYCWSSSKPVIFLAH